jgi:uncharacterized membrane protein YraQ (UPF0718 family)
MWDIFTKLADFLVYSDGGLNPDTAWGQAVHFFVMDTTKIFTMLLILLFLVGILRTWISPEKIKIWLEGRHRMTGYFLAVCLGVITPFCSCSSIPLFIGFLSAGIPLGITMAFLITSPMVNEVAVILFGQAIGWEFTLAYAAVGMIIGGLGGWLCDWLGFERFIETGVQMPLETKPTSQSCCCSCSTDSSKTSQNKKSRLYLAWQETKQIIRRIWFYVVLGIAVGAGLHGYVPQEWVIIHANADNLLAVPLAVVAAVPLYANVTGLVPIAEVFIAKGVPTGTTLAFIMATAAISIPELLILRRMMKLPLMAFLVGFLVLAFIIVGYSFNTLF